MSDQQHEERQRIWDAALALWSEKGFADTTMRELARRAKIGLGDLYRHFPSQEHLVLALYDSLNDRAVQNFLAEDNGEPDLAANLKRLLEIKLQLLEQHRAAVTALLREAVDPQSPLSPLSADSTPTRNRMLALLEDFLRRTGVGEDESQRVAKAMWLAHLLVLVFWLHDRSQGSANTLRIIEKFAAGVSFLPMFAASADATELLHLMGSLLLSSEPQVSAQADPVSIRDDSRQCDVVVIGAGPIGVIYASWLKLARPETSVLVLERDEQPGHKIGESTLSGFCKAARSVGVPHEAMQRLFYPKNGLGFFHVNEATRDLSQASEYILETFDETFQVERRPLDSLLIANARRLGVDVIQGAAVDVDRSTCSAAGGAVVYQIGGRDFRATCKLLVDASGPAGVLGRRVGQYTDDGLPFQSSAVWGYFRNVRRLRNYRWPRRAQFSRDEYTQHLCFKEGWLWYIPLISWQAAPDANLQSLLQLALDRRQPLPPRQQLSRDFGCPTSDITSIGLVLRGDRDDQLRDDPRAAFEYYRHKYPAIGQLLEGAQLEDHYSWQRPYSSRVNFRRYARQVSGDGWLLIGDAAFFVDPLISPGLTGGVAVAYAAAQATLAALEADDFSRGTFVDFETFTHRLHHALERDNQLVYMSFNHPQALALIQRFQEIDARRHFQDHVENAYHQADTNVWGILDAQYQRMQTDLHHILREAEHAVGIDVPVAEQSAADYEPMVRQISDCVRRYLDQYEQLNPYVTQNRAQGEM